MEYVAMALLAICSYVMGFSSGHRKGWIEAHLTVADECEKLGKFYVGKKVFTCTKSEIVQSEEDK